MSTLSQKDKTIRETLAKISPVINDISKEPNTSSPKFEKESTNFQQHLTQLKKQLQEYKENNFSYEFYREASDVVEQITQIRLNPELRLKLKTHEIMAKFNDLVGTLRAAVFRHKSLVNSAAKSKYSSFPIDSLEHAREEAKATAEKAARAAAEAEQANEIGLAFIEKIQKEQTQGKIPSQQLIDESFEHTLTIYAKNAAAILAMDEAAIALANLDDVIEKHKKDLK